MNFAIPGQSRQGWLRCVHRGPGADGMTRADPPHRVPLCLVLGERVSRRKCGYVEEQVREHFSCLMALRIAHSADFEALQGQAGDLFGCGKGAARHCNGCVHKN